MKIIKNAAGKWLIEATDEEMLWLDCKVQEFGCEECLWVKDCDFDHATCMDPSWKIRKAAERVQYDNREN